MLLLTEFITLIHWYCSYLYGFFKKSGAINSTQTGRVSLPYHPITLSPSVVGEFVPSTLYYLPSTIDTSYVLMKEVYRADLLCLSTPSWSPIALIVDFIVSAWKSAVFRFFFSTRAIDKVRYAVGLDYLHYLQSKNRSCGPRCFVIYCPPKKIWLTSTLVRSDVVLLNFPFVVTNSDLEHASVSLLACRLTDDLP